MTVRSQNVRMDTEVDGSWEGKRREGWEKGLRKEKRKCLPTWMECDQVLYELLHVCLCVTLYDNVHMYYSNSQLTD